MSENITNNPSVPTQIVSEVKFPRFINNLGIIPTSYKDSMSYYETLAWLCKFLEETVIPSVNENGEAVEELQALYIQLNDYVSHYFDNLDVQEEINNKLDVMAQDGTLQNIIGDYISNFKIVNVLDYGAKGDGITDDTTAINNAIEYAQNNNLTNVLFPTGTYIINSANEEIQDGGICITGTINLIGTGENSIIKAGETTKRKNTYVIY